MFEEDRNEERTRLWEDREMRQKTEASKNCKIRKADSKTKKKQFKLGMEGK